MANFPNGFVHECHNAVSIPHPTRDVNWILIFAEAWYFANVRVSVVTGRVI